MASSQFTTRPERESCQTPPHGFVWPDTPARREAEHACNSVGRENSQCLDCSQNTAESSRSYSWNEIPTKLSDDFVGV